MEWEHDRNETPEPGMTEEAPPPKPAKKHKAAGFRLLLVQCISCLCILLVAWLFRSIGGAAFEELKARLSAALMDNTVVDTVMGLLETQPTEEEVVTTTTLETEGTTTAPREVATGETEPTEPLDGTGGPLVKPSGMRAGLAPQGSSFAPLSAAKAAGLPLAQGELSSRFGYRLDPFTGELAFHTGTDIAVPEGSPILSLYDGTVSLVLEEPGGYGRYIVVEHGGSFSTLYAHCSDITAAVGQRVKAGETIAKAGNTGLSSGSHLHLEVLIGKIAHDPAYILPLERYD